MLGLKAGSFDASFVPSMIASISFYHVRHKCCIRAGQPVLKLCIICHTVCSPEQKKETGHLHQCPLSTHEGKELQTNASSCLLLAAASSCKLIEPILGLVGVQEEGRQVHVLVHHTLTASSILQVCCTFSGASRCSDRCMFLFITARSTLQVY